MDPHALHRIRRTVKAGPEGSAQTTQILTGRIKAWLASKGTDGSALAPRDAGARLPRRAASMGGVDAPRQSFTLPTSQLASAEAPRRDGFGVRAASPAIAAPTPITPVAASISPAAPSPGGDVSPSFASLTARDRTKFAAAAAETPFFDGDLDDDPLPSSVFKRSFLTPNEGAVSHSPADDFAAPHPQRVT